MAVVIGSARGDEHSSARGGSAGDQKQKKTPDYNGEVSMQNWYLHSKGWIVIRAKSAAVREKIAQDMEWACNNANIGYDQGERDTLYSVAKKVGFNCSKVTTKCETDCSALVRVCVNYAGVKVGDFYTGDEVKVLENTGEFEILRSDKYCKSSDYLLRGDILVTKKKGHTVVVLTNGSQTVSDGTGDKEDDQAVNPAQSFDERLAGLYMVTTALYLRKGAGKEYKDIAVMPRDSKVRNYGYYTSVGGVKWLYVQYGSMTGFCSSKYLSKI